MVTPTDKQGRAVELYVSGLDLQQVAKVLKVSTATVYRICHTAGVIRSNWVNKKPMTPEESASRNARKRPGAEPRPAVLPATGSEFIRPLDKKRLMAGKA